MRTKLGALLGAGGLLLLAASATLAVPPTYTINVSKTADPASVPVSGGTVVFTVWVTGTGTGFLQTVTIVDSLGGCTLGAKVETSGDGDDKLETGETWSYSCTVNNVTPGTQNTATVDACHDVSSCNQDAHDAQGVGNVTVTEGPEVTEAPPTDAPTEAPPTDAPTSNPDPTEDQAGATEPTTDTVGFDGAAGGGVDRTLLLVLALGMLMASLILVTPSRPVRQR